MGIRLRDAAGAGERAGAGDREGAVYRGEGPGVDAEERATDSARTSSSFFASCRRNWSARLPTSRVRSVSSSCSADVSSSASRKAGSGLRFGLSCASIASLTSGTSSRSTIRIPAFTAMRRSARPLVRASSSLALQTSKPARTPAKRCASISGLFCAFDITHPNSHFRKPPCFFPT